MIANKAWGTDSYREHVTCEAIVYRPRAGRITLALIQSDTRRFQVEGETGAWRGVYTRLGEELAKYQEPCTGCSCSPCQCEERGLRRPLFAAQRDYLNALQRARAAERAAGTDRRRTPEEIENDAMAEMCEREAADTAFGTFARLAAAHDMVAMLDGSMRPGGGRP